MAVFQTVRAGEHRHGVPVFIPVAQELARRRAKAEVVGVNPTGDTTLPWCNRQACRASNPAVKAQFLPGGPVFDGAHSVVVAFLAVTEAGPGQNRRSSPISFQVASLAADS
jgi:hypothetical protein